MSGSFPKTDDKLQGVAIRGPIPSNAKHIFNAEALALVATLDRNFNGERKRLLANRKEQQKLRDQGFLPDLLPETKHIRDDPTWTGPPLAPGLQDRRCEITGPTDRKMVINALNANVYTYMADFEGKFKIHYAIVRPIGRPRCSLRMRRLIVLSIACLALEPGTVR